MYSRLGDPRNFPMNERGHNFQNQFCAIDSLRGKHVSKLALGGEHSVLVTTHNDVYVAGEGSRGQLGTGENERCVTPVLLEKIKKTGREILQVTCGNSCTVMLVGKFNPVSLAQTCTEVVTRFGLDKERVDEVGGPQKDSSLSALDTDIAAESIALRET